MSNIVYYVIQVKMPSKLMYICLIPEVDFVSDKKYATAFESKMLAYGWLLKAKSLYRTYQFSVIEL